MVFSRDGKYLGQIVSLECYGDGSPFPRHMKSRAVSFTWRHPKLWKKTGGPDWEWEYIRNVILVCPD